MKSRFLSPLIAGFLSLTATLQAVDYLQIPGGQSVTVANAVAIKQEISDPREGIELDVYDRTTGILIGNVAEAQAHKTAQIQTDAIGLSLYNQEKAVVATVVGIERRKGDKVLPFAYYRVAKKTEVPSGTLLFDEQGHAIAFYYVDHDKAPNQGYIVPVQAVVRAHTDYAMNGSISRSWAGLIVSSTGTVPEVISVRPDSPAAKGGIQRGDILVQVGDTKVTSYLEVVDTFYYLIPGVPETFTVLRDGTSHTLQVTSISRDALLR